MLAGSILFLYIKGVVIRDIEGVFNGFLPDSRLEKRADKIMVDMFNLEKQLSINLVRHYQIK